MPITAEQRLVNDRWLLNIARHSKNWYWPDKGNTYAINNDNKFCPTNKQAYRDLIAITSLSFARDHIEKL